MIIHRSLLHAIGVAARDVTRYFMNGIHVTKDGRVQATDGHLAIEARLTHPECKAEDYPSANIPEAPEELPNAGVVLGADTIKNLLKTAPKNGGIPVLNYVAVGKERAAATNLDATVTGRTIPDAQFPDFTRVMPKGEPIQRLTFDARLMRQLCDTLIKMREDGPEGARRNAPVALTLHVPEKADSVIKFTTNPKSGLDATALLMPVRE